MLLMTAPFLFLLLLTGQSGAAPNDAPAEAVVRLQAAIRENPRNESNYTELGNLLLRTQNFGEAALVLEGARKQFPESAQAALSLGVAYYGLRRFEDAVSAFLEAGRLAPDAEQPIAFLSRMAENWGARKPDVVALFRGYVQHRPQTALGHFALGRATGDASELQHALRLQPRMAEAHNELGIVLEAQRDFPGAIAAFQRAAALAPRNPVPHYRLSRLYARTGDSSRAATERALHEKLAAEEKAELDRRQAATKHLKLKVRPQPQ
jgi:tetratricopeptide (TPR) repeat protein